MEYLRPHRDHYLLSFKKLKLGEEITLGKPLPGTKVWVQTKKKNERTGELYVAGPSVGFGYINNIELTKNKFLPITLLLSKL